MADLRKYSHLLVTVLVALIMANPCFAQGEAPEWGPNLVRNSSFDNDIAAWEIPADVAEMRTDQANVRIGTRSLRFTNADPAVYKSVTQVVPAKVGDSLRFSVWVKGQDITSVNTQQGAGIYMEGLDAGGNWVTGSYAACYTGTYDWKQSASVYRVPATVSKVIVGLYMRKDSIGTAWFDDVQVQVEQEKMPAVQAALLSPNYRGLVLPNDNRPWQIQLRLFPPSFKTASVQVKSTISSSRGGTLSEKVSQLPVNGEKQILSIPSPATLKPGDYSWKLEVTDATGTVHTPQFAIHVVSKMPANYVDAEGFTVVNGQRFFPMGLYLGATEEDHLQRMSAGGFNTILSYGYGVGADAEAYLDRANKHNLHVIYSLKDFYAGMQYAPKNVTDLEALAAETVTKLRKKPALMSWYINDELEPDFIPKIQSMYDRLVKTDPDHPILSMLIDPGISDKYLPSTDIIGSDPYPVTGSKTHLRKTTTYTQLSADSAGKSKSTLMALQIYDFANYGGSNVPYQPTRDDIRNQAYQAIANGAKGLILYSYFDLWVNAAKPGEADNATFEKRWLDVAAVGNEIKSISPIILHGEVVPLTVIDKAGSEVRAIQYKNELHLFLANPYYSPTKMILSLPKGWKPAQAKQGDIEGVQDNNRLTLNLPSIGSGVFRLVRQ